MVEQGGQKVCKHKKWRVTAEKSVFWIEKDFCMWHSPRREPWQCRWQTLVSLFPFSEHWQEAFFVSKYICSFKQFHYNSFIHSFTHSCVCVTHTHGGAWHECRDQRTTYRSQFSPSTVWDLDMELRFLSLASSSFSCTAMSPSWFALFK